MKRNLHSEDDQRSNGVNMAPDEIEYKSHRLIVLEQPGGGFLVEATPLAGGQTLRTKTYQSSREAIEEAETNIDKYDNGRR
jgi:hypothetical protein